MRDLEKIMNRKIVKGIFRYYGYKGQKRIDELFGKEKEKGLGALLGRIPLQAAVKIGMKKIGLNKKLTDLFFSKYFNRQTLMNIIRTVAKNGLTQPFRFDAPLLIVWNYTSLCNLRCSHCYQNAGKPLDDELSFEERIDLINQMVDAGVAYIAFSGGEPLLGDRFWDVLNYAGRFLHISIATNGTLLEDRTLVDRLADYGVKNVFVSLDGASQESNDFIRGDGSFNRTIRGLKNLVLNEHLHCGINTVVTQRNFREVPDILKLAMELGVNSFNHYNFIPAGRGKDDFDMDLTPEQREELLTMLAEWHFKKDETGLNMISTAPQYARVLCDMAGGKSAGLFHYTADNATSIQGLVKYAGGCGAGRVYASVQPNGLVGPCVFMPQVVIGNIREERFIDIWKNSDLGKKLSDRENYHRSCPKYQYVCGGCRARALAYGDILGPDPGCLVYKNSCAMNSEDIEKKEVKVPVS